MIFRFWLGNIGLSIGLFILYRIAIDSLNPSDTTIGEKFYHIMDVFLHVLLSAFYLIAIVVSSLSFFLNQVERIRKSYFLSFLTFSAIPLCFVFFLGIVLAVDMDQYRAAPSSLTVLFYFSLIYLLCPIIEFFIFRKKITTYS